MERRFWKPTFNKEHPLLIESSGMRAPEEDRSPSLLLHPIRDIESSLFGKGEMLAVCEC